MQPNPKPTPIVTPVLALLNSRKTMTTLIGALISLAVPFAPGLEAQRENLLTIALIMCPVLVGILTHSIAVEDAAAKSAPTTVNTGSGDVQVTPPPTQTLPRSPN